MSKHRNYSFSKSKRIPPDRMTIINGVKIPSVPGCCYHGIICSLARHKNNFVEWKDLIVGTQKHMRKYGGPRRWENFVKKTGVRNILFRIKENTHTLTRKGRNCYGFRLHELGMCIYFFKDGAFLLVGGQLALLDRGYDVKFPDGRKIQSRYRGTALSSREYKIFQELKYINASCQILNHNAMRKYRLQHRTIYEPSIESIRSKVHNTGVNKIVHVCLTLKDECNDNILSGFKKVGLKIEMAHKNELIGTIKRKKLSRLKKDKNIVEILES